LGITRTTRLFAVIDASIADAIINCWRLKYDWGYWRPFQAIHGADTDDNPLTEVNPNWAPLVPNPPYPDYVSGHGSITGACAEATRIFLGDDVPLVLRPNETLVRSYSTLSAIEHDAFHARIWGGLHFRDAMEDAYRIGHHTAHKVHLRID